LAPLEHGRVAVVELSRGQRWVKLSELLPVEKTPPPRVRSLCARPPSGLPSLHRSCR